MDNDNFVFTGFSKIPVPLCTVRFLSSIGFQIEFYIEFMGKELPSWAFETMFKNEHGKCLELDSIVDNVFNNTGVSDYEIITDEILKLKERKFRSYILF